MGAFLLSKAGLILIAVVVVAISLAIVARNWSCRKTWIDRRDERRDERSQKEATFVVSEVIDGATLDVLAGRFKRSNRITLLGIEIPAEVAQEAKENLIRLTSGGRVRVQWVHHGLFSVDGEPVMESEYDAAAPISGVCYGVGNCCLNLQQLRAGLAKCNSEANDVMRADESYAKKAKKGIWAK